ncbi:MAG: hypothetical protein HY717_16760 [Planctomycetes bacterium]|nr:hypothetical protein [Planctomycetota bacterium]
MKIIVQLLSLPIFSFLFLVLGGGSRGFSLETNPGPIFEPDILPVLKRRCVECHGTSKQSGGLRLDSFKNLTAGGKKGAVLEAGNSLDSLLVELIEARGKRRMPPKGDPLPLAEVELIKRWIDAGTPSDPALLPEEPEVKVGDLPAGFEPILAIAGEREGKRLAVGRGAAILIFFLPVENSGRPARVLKGHRDVVQCLQFNPTGRILASGAFQEAILWDAETWTELRRLGPHRDRVLALDFSPDGNLLATGGGEPSLNGELKVWEAPTGKLMLSLPEAHADAIFSIRFNPGGTQVATAAADRMVHLTDLASGKRVARFEGHTQHVLGVAYAADGKRLLSAGADGKIKLWNTENSAKISDWSGHSKGVMAIACSPDGKLAASVSGDRTLRIWNTDNGSQLNAFGEAKDYLYGIALFGAGRFIATGGKDLLVRIYDTRENKLIRTIDLTQQ